VCWMPVLDSHKGLQGFPGRSFAGSAIDFDRRTKARLFAPLAPYGKRKRLVAHA
jgi:hypothetical protein